MSDRTGLGVRDVELLLGSVRGDLASLRARYAELEAYAERLLRAHSIALGARARLARWLASHGPDGCPCDECAWLAEYVAAERSR